MKFYLTADVKDMLFDMLLERWRNRSFNRHKSNWVNRYCM